MKELEPLDSKEEKKEMCTSEVNSEVRTCRYKRNVECEVGGVYVCMYECCNTQPGVRNCFEEYCIAYNTAKSNISLS